MQLLLVGYGKMGRMVESLAGEYGCTVAGVIDPLSPSGQDGPEADRWRNVDVAIDFSTPDSVARNVPLLLGRGISVGIGTTGWQKDEPAIRAALAGADAAVVAAPNFSTGVLLFEAIVARASALVGAQRDFGAWLHEAHHSTKKDAPSGTAFSLKKTMEGAGFPRPIDVSSTRAGHSRDAYRRVRRPRRDDHVDAHGARPFGLRPRRARRGDVGARQTRMVHDARRARPQVGRPFQGRQRGRAGRAWRVRQVGQVGKG